MKPVRAGGFGVLGRDQRREDGDGDEGRHEERPENRDRVANQPVAGLAPQPRRRLDLDLTRFEFGDAHQLYRMRGLMIAYERSTSRFTSTKTSARNRIPPCRTG